MVCMNRHFHTTRHVDAPPERVWDVLTDVARWPEWTPTVTSVERLDDGPLAVGSQVVLRQPRLPKASWTVTEVVAGRRFTWEATSPGIRSVASHEVVTETDGSRVTLELTQHGPMGAVAALAWRRLTQRYVDLEAESLARRVTHSPPEA
jgi:uncharacterized protein YndB with AHSA1/START domain